MIRDIVCISAAAALGLFLAGAAFAAPDGSSSPAVSHYVQPSGNFDPDLCDFPLVENGVDKVTELDSFDSSGNLTQQVFQDKFTGTVRNPANGITLSVDENAKITEDYVAGTETWDGVAERFSYPKGSIITQDTGEIVFAADGSIASENGSHPIAEGPGTTAVCNVLSGS